MKSRYLIPAIIAVVVHLVFLFGFSSKPSDAHRFASIEPLEDPQESNYELPPAPSQAPQKAETGARPLTAPSDLNKEDFVASSTLDIKPVPFGTSPDPGTFVPGSLPHETSPEVKEWLEDISERYGRVETLKALDKIPDAQVSAAPPPSADGLSTADSVVVWVTFVINRKGEVVEAKAEENTPETFARAAEETVRAWRFDPGTLKGKPVVFRMSAPISVPATVR